MHSICIPSCIHSKVFVWHTFLIYIYCLRILVPRSQVETYAIGRLHSQFPKDGENMPQKPTQKQSCTSGVTKSTQHPDEGGNPQPYIERQVIGPMLSGELHGIKHHCVNRYGMRPCCPGCEMTFESMASLRDHLMATQSDIVRLQSLAVISLKPSTVSFATFMDQIDPGKAIQAPSLGGDSGTFARPEADVESDSEIEAHGAPYAFSSKCKQESTEECAVIETGGNSAEAEENTAETTEYQASNVEGDICFVRCLCVFYFCLFFLVPVFVHTFNIRM